MVEELIQENKNENETVNIDTANVKFKSLNYMGQKDYEPYKFTNVGQSIAGKICKFGISNYGKMYVILDVNESKNKIVNCSTDLERQLSDFKESGEIAEGSIIRITYVKEIPMKGLNKHNLKKFLVEKGEW